MLCQHMRRASAIALLVLVCIPSAAMAMPVKDPQTRPSHPPAQTTLVREVPADDTTQTLSLILSGVAVVVAAGAAARSVSVRPATAGPAAPTSPRRGGQRGR
jgi:hypothetical protein